MKKYIFLIMLFCLAFSQADAADAKARSCGIWLNDVPAVADSTSARLYFTLKKDCPQSFSGVLRWDADVYESVEVNGNAFKSPTDTWNVENWKEQNSTHAMQVKTTDKAGKVKEWSVVFTNLPLILIEARQSTLYEVWKNNNDEKVPTVVTIIDANKRTYETTTTTDAEGNEIKTDGEGIIDFCSFAGVRVRGATSAGKDKKPFALELRDEAGNEKDIHLLGYRNDGDWILDAMFNDPLRMRNRLITDIWNSVQDLPYDKDNDFQRNGTDGEYVEIFLKGQYWGIYCFTDKIDRKKLNLKKTKDAGLPTEVTRGMLWKSLFRCSATTFNSYSEDPKTGTFTWERTDKDVTWEQKYPDDRPDQGDFTPIAEMIDAVGAKASNEDCWQNLEQKFYMDNLTDYIIFTQALQLMDNLQKNMYLSVRNVTKDSKLLITPWDLDASLGRTAGGDVLNSDKKWMAFGEQLGGINHLFWKLTKTNAFPEFRKRVFERWEQLKANELSLENIEMRMKDFADMVTDNGAYAREYELWNRKMNPGENGLYEEISFVMDFLRKNYQAFDAEMKNWGFNGTTTPDNPNNPDENTVETPMHIYDTTIPYGKGYAIKVVTMAGDSIYCMFGDKPAISFNGNTMTMTAEKEQTWTWEIPEVDFWAFQYIDNPDPSGINIYVVDELGNKHTRWFTLDGKEVRPEQLGKGVYLMKVGNKTIKLLKK